MPDYTEVHIEVEPKLTLKQEKFIDAYIETGNGAAAARLAGYSEHTAREIACENLAKPNIKSAIAKRRSELMKDSETKVLSYLLQLESEAGDKDNSGSERIRSLELLIKAHGGFIDRQEVAHFDGSFLADLSLDEEPELPESGPKPNEIKDIH